MGKRTWRKLYLCVDEHHQIVACDLTTKEIGDSTALPALLEHMATFMADGAYDGKPTYQHLLNHSPDADIIIPPPKNAVTDGFNAQRDTHIKSIQRQGRMVWQKKTHYGLHAYVELVIQRYKRIISPSLKARELPQQKSRSSGFCSPVE